MCLSKIVCAERICPYNRKPCCFGEVETDTVPSGGEQIRERHKCKAKKGVLVAAQYQMEKRVTA